jgi:hypothetical protein
MPYYVSPSNVTPEEPCQGWYYVETNEDGEETLRGPFYSKHDALDHESDGAYSSYLENKRHERDETYREGMINAGRGHLLRESD